MSVNRKVTVPVGSSGAHERSVGGPAVPLGAVVGGRRAQPAGEHAQDGEGHARLLAQDALRVPGREREAGRRRLAP